MTAATSSSESGRFRRCLDLTLCGLGTNGLCGLSGLFICGENDYDAKLNQTRPFKISIRGLEKNQKNR
jgi:hypothetical protein